MKLRIELDDAAPEEIIIRTSRVDERIKRIQDAVLGALRGGEIAVRRGEEECYIPYREVLYFETENGRIRAHTANESFFCPLRLNELEELLPRHFTRASKGCVVNTAHIRSISRSPTGVSEATFSVSDKRIFISRMYYKIVREIIEETRL